MKYITLSKRGVVNRFYIKGYPFFGRIFVFAFGVFFSLDITAAEDVTQGKESAGVTFSVTDCLFKSECRVSLSGAKSGEVIRYTLDQTIPNSQSSRYEKELVLSESCQIKAAIFSGDKKKGDIQVRSYLALESDLYDFKSKLPVVIIKSWAKNKPQQHAFQDAVYAVIEPDHIEKLQSQREGGIINVSHFGLCGIKRRGSSSANYPKYSLHLETRKSSGEDDKSKLLNFPAGSDWILGGSYQNDRALIRDDLMYELARQSKMYAPRSQLVEVILDLGDQKISYKKNYFGVYSLIEKIKKGKKRIKLRHLASEGKQISKHENGILFKYDRPAPGEQGIEIFDLGTFYWVFPKERNATAQQIKDLRSRLSDFYLAVRSPKGIHPVAKRHFSEMIDSLSWVRWHLMNELAGNLDSYKASAYFSLPINGHGNYGKIYAGPIWDFDHSLNSVDPRDDSPFGWVASGYEGRTFGNQLSPWWGFLLEDQDFRQLHTDEWQRLRSGPLSWKNIEQLINQLAEQLQAEDLVNLKLPNIENSPVERNFQRWPEKPPRGGTHAGEIKILKDWLRMRLKWMDAQLTPLPIFSHSSSVMKKGSQITISAPKGFEIYYTLDGSDPRASGGRVSPLAVLDRVYTIRESSVVIARAKLGNGLTSWSGPVKQIYLVGDANNVLEQQGLELADIVAEPILEREYFDSDGNKFAAADFEYFKLVNPSQNKSVDLTGARFVEGIRFSFDEKSVQDLKPQEFLYLCRNKEAFEKLYGVEMVKKVRGQYGPSKIDNSGERLVLKDGIGRILLDYSYYRKD